MGEVFVRFVFTILFWLLMLPVCWVLGTPFILVAALFMKNSYGENVKRGYGAMTDFWLHLTTTP